ncbi:sugar nucleotide-binding protein [Vibrio sp. EA2]|uniref:sugar nucleotide-binding protein n=1 Tax=Vibrio sp. EA2 TaxID=3079860 RepID=UPI002949EC33|nr:sugar nucleotide-binding protein [Vibrio sp. EA2]MDV6253500.1 sugar nucleotide-binding protein [Vibrio sp. EA2]
MKRILMTGLTGSLGPIVARQFTARGWEVIEWNHYDNPPNNKELCEQFLNPLEVDAICHMALGREEWAAWLADKCAKRNIPYLFTSTAMVFDSSNNGPYKITNERDTKDQYGLYKVRCEDAIWDKNPDAMIARLGWQFHDDKANNNMLSHLDRLFASEGKIQASTHWLPATSHMEDTAIACLQLIERNIPGLYHLDSNVHDQWSFYQLVCTMKKYYNRPWIIERTSDYKHDQRLIDERIAVPNLSYRFADI